MRKHGKKGVLPLRFAVENRTQAARTGVSLSFVPNRQACRWSTDARQAVGFKH